MCVNFNELLGGLLEEDRQSIVTEALLSNQIAINNLWSCKPLPRADSSQLISAVENVPEHKPTFTSSYQPSPPPNYLTVIGFKYCVACQCFAPCSFGNENSLYLTYHRFTFMHVLNYWSWMSHGEGKNSTPLICACSIQYMQQKQRKFSSALIQASKRI